MLKYIMISVLNCMYTYTIIMVCSVMQVAMTQEMISDSR